MIIKLNKNKSLQITSSNSIFTGESNSELIQILINSSDFPVELKECNVLLYYSSENTISIEKQLFLSDEEYKGRYVYETFIDSSMTSKSGKLKIWIEIINDNVNFTYKSNSTFINVTKSEDKILSTQELMQADSDILKIYNEIKDLYSKIYEESNKVSEIAQLIFELYETQINIDSNNTTESG